MFGNSFSEKQIEQIDIPPPSRRQDAFDIHLDFTWKIEAVYKKRRGNGGNGDMSVIPVNIVL